MISTPQPSQPPKKSPFLRIFLVLLGLFIVWSLYIGSQIYSFSKVDETARADVAIVLGAGIRNDRPSGVFRERINHAIDLYERRLVDAIILTGGVGPGNDLAGSEAARLYAIENGIPDERIYIETSSTDTVENLTEAKELMETQNLQTALVVSDPLHMYRAMSIADDLRIEASASPTPTSRIDSTRAVLNFLVREIASVTVYFLFPAS
jgi:uncharacterized SAM-binding protein YcdF (DUF218 family)